MIESLEYCLLDILIQSGHQWCIYTNIYKTKAYNS